jgi:hypothetical protein
MKDTIYSRNCPDCSKELKTTNKYYFKKAVTNNQKCGSCSLKGKPKSEEAKRNMRENHADFSGDKNPFYGKNHSDEVLSKLSETLKETYSDPKLRKRRSVEKLKWHKNNDNPFKGKIHSDEAKEVIREKAKLRWEDINQRKKASEKTLEYHKTNDNNFKGKKHSTESLRKMRLAAIERISIAKFNGNQMMPNYNISSISILEEIAKEMGITDLQHAENGGEFFIKELGYFVDGYSKEKNVILEYDEPHHFNSDGSLKESDVIRQKEIEEYLKCEFIRIVG